MTNLSRKEINILSRSTKRTNSMK